MTYSSKVNATDITDTPKNLTFNKNAGPYIIPEDFAHSVDGTQQ